MKFLNLQCECNHYKKELLHAAESVINQGSFILGREVAELEKTIAEFAKVKHAIATSSGTDSLILALQALGIGRGDEVLTVPFTWISTISAILLVGATPVFVDIDPQTYLMNEDLIEEKITPKTKAIIPVSLFGQMPDFSRINALAKSYNLAVIEDGAQSFGAEQKGVKSCGASLIGITSFYPTKPFGGFGDGGALFTNDDDLAEKMRLQGNHGLKADGLHYYVGINGRMDTLQAALLLVKWPYFLKELETRSALAKRYSDNLDHPPIIKEGNTHIFSQYTIRLKERDAVAACLNKLGVPTRIYYPYCAYEHPGYAFLGKGMCPESEKACREVLSLPLYPSLQESEQDKVMEALQCALV